MTGADVREWDELFLAGRWKAPVATRAIEVISPHTEAVWGRCPEAGEFEVDEAVAAARQAVDHGPWPRMTPQERIAVIERFAARYLEGHGEMAEVISGEMGSPIAFSRVGQSWAVWHMITTMINLAREHPWTEDRPTILGTPATVRRTPVGVVAAITPWNVPQITIMAKLVPALLAGCAVIVKPSPEAPLDALLMARWLEEAGLPEGAVSVLPAGREVGEHLVRHRGVDKVAFTGSTAAGRRIGGICGEQVKRVSLELGGKSAAVVLDDADPTEVANGLRFGSFMNSGQACAAQTRVVVPASREAEFVDALTSMVGSLVVGDPMDDATEIGPMVSRRQQERVVDYIQVGVAEGAVATVGGPERPAGLDRGWYVRPTLFVGDNSMRIAREEIFGPVVTVIPSADEADAIAIANDSDFGLAGSIWSADEDHAFDVAAQIRTGTVGINKYAPDFTAPFGGFKDSGVGREYGSEGLDAFTEVQSIAR